MLFPPCNLLNVHYCLANCSITNQTYLQIKCYNKYCTLFLFCIIVRSNSYSNTYIRQLSSHQSCSLLIIITGTHFKNNWRVLLRNWRLGSFQWCFCFVALWMWLIKKPLVVLYTSICKKRILLFLTIGNVNNNHSQEITGG